MKFYSFDLDLKLMTLVLKVYLDIIKMYVCTENKVPSFSSLNVIYIDTQTDSTVIITYPHTGIVSDMKNITKSC